MCFLNLQVIPAFEEAITGMSLGGVRRCCILLSVAYSFCLLNFQVDALKFFVTFICKFHILARSDAGL